MEKKISPNYRFIRAITKAIYPRIEVEGIENLPKGPAIVVGNHSQMHGPVACQLYFPGNKYIWCISEMMHLSEVPAYAYKDFWSNKPKGVRFFFKILSYIIAPISVSVFNNADTIPVYKDKRVTVTFKESVKRLKEGASVIIFPECYDEHNNIVHEFQQGFVDVAKRYFKETKEEIPFVPLYVCPKLKKLIIGKPVYFNNENDIHEERIRICNYLMDEISEMAYQKPYHKVVPYPNIKKKDYPDNTRLVI